MTINQKYFYFLLIKMVFIFILCMNPRLDLSTDNGIIKFLNDLHPSKTETPRKVTEDGNDICLVSYILRKHNLQSKLQKMESQILFVPMNYNKKRHILK